MRCANPVVCPRFLHWACGKHFPVSGFSFISSRPAALDRRSGWRVRAAALHQLLTKSQRASMLFFVRSSPEHTSGTQCRASSCLSWSISLMIGEATCQQISWEQCNKHSSQLWPSSLYCHSETSKYARCPSILCAGEGEREREKKKSKMLARSMTLCFAKSAVQFRVRTPKSASVFTSAQPCPGNWVPA